MEKKQQKTYESPVITEIVLENENILCSSQMEKFRDGGDWTWGN